MKRIKLLLLLPAMLLFLQASHPAYQVFDAKGRLSDFDEMVKSCRKADIILFGELHNNPICHWLELEITKSLHAKHGKNLILGAEMFENDDQRIMDEYLNNLIPARHFEKEAKLWKNYSTDYKPLVKFAREKQLRFIATNIPRRYASYIARNGLASLDSLDRGAKKYIAPLPIEYDSELPNYKKMQKMQQMADHGAKHLVEAQVSKDATMAYFIMNNLKDGSKFLHFNGSYHSNNFEGIYWHLKKIDPNLKIVTISSVQQENTGILKKKYFDLADFTICIPSSMTKTY